MISANELRIGNWVKYDNRYFQIHSIADIFPTLNTDEFGIGIVDYNNIEPAEITTEILEAAGFENKMELYFNGKWTNIEIKYLHQLQNLYHALTGEELEIQLNKIK
ncbi:MAG TPA: hypothetical protein V6C58_04150 [Allocoleopsis sp.]